ncbi:MAG TPA: hypothetical protein VFR41_03370, partial [Acidimicrobiia bacterium]|nr:hypothetical protein [Acidimicrobiia bacterium]
MVNLVVRVWLPDRPGALGLVASRIGAIGGDIVGVEVLERSDTVAVDEFAVVLNDDDVVPLMLREIEEVDGASVEECRRVETFPDARLDALTSVEAIISAADATQIHLLLAHAVRDEFAADWTAIVAGGALVVSAGDDVPSTPTLDAFAAGAAASPAV